MLLNHHSPYLLERISKGGDKVKALKCSECVDISLVKLQALGVLSFDVLCLQHFRNAEGKMCEDSDRMVLYIPPPYMSALYVNALYVCLICMPYMPCLQAWQKGWGW